MSLPMRTHTHSHTSYLHLHILILTLTLTLSSSHLHTHTLPQEQDEPVLEHLTDIKIIYLDDTGMVRYGKLCEEGWYQGTFFSHL